MSPQASILSNLSNNSNITLTTAGYTGLWVPASGLNGGIIVGMLFTYGGVASDTGTLTLQGTIDGINPFQIAFAQVDSGIAQPVPVGSIVIGGSPTAPNTRYYAFQANVSPLAAIRILLSNCQSGGASANWQGSALSAVNFLSVPI